MRHYPLPRLYEHLMKIRKKKDLRFYPPEIPGICIITAPRNACWHISRFFFEQKKALSCLPFLIWEFSGG
jgi:hypothetical protein